MRLHKYTEGQLRNAVKTSNSIREALTKLGVAAEGGNYRVFHRAVSHFGVDTSPFTGQLWSKGRKLGPARPTEDYLENKAGIRSAKLRARLIREGYFEHQCSFCKRRTWLGRLIPLELDHIDGNHENNRLENLRVLCPNCHATTPTYRGKNQKRAT